MTSLAFSSISTFHLNTAHATVGLIPRGASVFFPSQLRTVSTGFFSTYRLSSSTCTKLQRRVSLFASPFSKNWPLPFSQGNMRPSNQRLKMTHGPPFPYRSPSSIDGDGTFSPREPSRIHGRFVFTPTPKSKSKASSENSDIMPVYRGEIFCNRAINMARIKAVGFDMDYTLAMYHSEQFETLSASNALEKLVKRLGYPEPLLKLKYDHSEFIRGLVIDKERGNVLKLDRHKYVKLAMHGRNELSKEERTDMYDSITQSGGGFGEPRFAALDAMFALPDAFLFSHIVAYKDEHPEEISQDYPTIYRDVRRSVDMCHRDGSIKDEVKKDPQRFIEKDEKLVPMLKMLRNSGRKVFLLTNSLWDYTDVVMTFLCDSSKPGEWIDLFDVIITGSAKPAFMLNSHLPIYRCDPVTGHLTNTDGVLSSEFVDEYLQEGKCFQGGNFNHLHDLLGVSNGTHVLYVGDHIFSDVLRSKRTLGWRTMLIVPELEHEINTQYESDGQALAEDLQILNDARDEIDEWVDRLEGELIHQDVEGDEKAASRKEKIESELSSARSALENIRSKLILKTEEYHKQFHPKWGQMFKTGLQNSRFAEQVENYACLYTSKVTNIALVSPEINWRAMSDLMPHDRLTVAPMYRVLTKRAGSDNA